MIKTGYRGTFVIEWMQTEIDGLESAPVSTLTVGATWRWRGEAIRVDGPHEILRLDQAKGAEDLHRRAARSVRRLVGTSLEKQAPPAHTRDADEIPLGENSFVLTDGASAYSVTLVEVTRSGTPLLIFGEHMPPQNRDLWVVRHTLEEPATRRAPMRDTGVICFTSGTRILTPEGLRPIENLREGDLVQTKDNGAQHIQWMGSREMSGARLIAMPGLRPVRIAAQFFGDDRPDQDLVVSPDHRIVVKGDVARDLFNTPEVLVSAKDLINNTSVSVDMSLREVTYVHLLFERHQVLWANGVETESFHPAAAAMDSLVELDLLRLLAWHPELAHDPMSYGSFARRNLTTSEAAILTHAA